MASTATTTDTPSETSTEHKHDQKQIEQFAAKPSKPEPYLHRVQASPLEDVEKLAAEEGHDADIPSNAGYVLDERGERKRRESIARQRRESDARRSSRDIEKTAADAQPSDSNGDDDNDPNIVWWDGPDDPENPRNWPTWKKGINCALISAITFVTPLASSMFAPGVPEVMAEFGSDSNTLASFVVSVYVLGYAAGPLLIAPLSEIYGRTIIYHTCNFGFLVFIMASALAPNMNSLIAFRFLSGIFGSCPITNGGGSIADMIPQEQRALWMAFFSLGPLLGPIIGPIVGGFVSGGPGWRWCFWILLIIGGILALLMLVFSKETYAPVILGRKAAHLRKQTGNPLLRSGLDVGLSPRDYFKRGIVRPLKMLFRSPICVIFAFYIAIVYGYMYIMFTSFTPIFLSIYGFSTSTVGLTFLGLGIGLMAGLVYYSLTSDRYIKKKLAEDNEKLVAEGQEPMTVAKPEYRLRPLYLGALMLPVGLFIYGWTAKYKVHWIVPILGTLIVGAGNLITFMCLQLYLVDAFHIYAASALAANTVVRSVAGAVLPLAGLPLYDALGVGWGNSLLGFIAAALIPVPFLLNRYGEYLRKHFELKDL